MMLRCGRFRNGRTLNLIAMRLWLRTWHLNRFSRLGTQRSGGLLALGGSTAFFPFYGTTEKGDQGVTNRCALGTAHCPFVLMDYGLRPELLAFIDNHLATTERFKGFH